LLVTVTVTVTVTVARGLNRCPLSCELCNF
jgi:hypothetical protein